MSLSYILPCLQESRGPQTSATSSLKMAVYILQTLVTEYAQKNYKTSRYWLQVPPKASRCQSPLTLPLLGG